MQILSQEQKQDYLDNGYLILRDFIPLSICEALKQRSQQLITEFAIPEQTVIFSTQDQQHAAQEYFLNSGDKIHFFFEQKAFNASGQLIKDKMLAINKIGHALHELDPFFHCFSRSHKIAALMQDLDYADPRLVQSMLICKQPFIGGEVDCHQDASFLYVEGQPVIGLWFALEEATIENGCLWVLPGGHHHPLKYRFRRLEGIQTTNEIYDETPWDLDKLQALPVPAGSLILLHGNLPHLSKENLSPRSRQAYTLHIMSERSQYAPDNWLQRTDRRPFTGFF